MKLKLGLLLCLTLITACHVPETNKCVSDKPGFISVEDDFTHECVEINTALVRVVLDQGAYTYIMTVDAQGDCYPYKVVENFEIVQRKIFRAYRRLKLGS